MERVEGQVVSFFFFKQKTAYEMSAPWANAANPSGVAHVLSISTSAPRACAAAAIAGTSWISNDSDPGDPTNPTLVAGGISRSMPPAINGSWKGTPTPNAVRC